MSNRSLGRGLRLLSLAVMLWAFVFGWSLARAQPLPPLTGTWIADVGNTSGNFLQLEEDDQGRLRGSLQGRPLTGLHVAQQRVAAFVVGSPGAPSHLFYGWTYNDNGDFYVDGVVMSLRPGQQTYGSSFVHFKALLGAKPRSPTPVLGSHGPTTVMDLSGLHGASRPKATVRFQQGAAGELVGSWDGADVQGYFERRNSWMGAVRLVNGVPTEAMVGQHIGKPNEWFTLIALTPDALLRTLRVVQNWDLRLRGVGNLAGSWQINGNGWPGALELTQDADGRISGTMYKGEPVQGFYSRSERRMVLLRGPLQRPIQAYVGEVSADGEHWQGRFYTLDTGASGGSFGRNMFAFAAQRYAAAPPSALPPLVATQGTAPRLPRLFRFFNRPAEFQNTQAGWLDFATITGLNEFDGTLFGDPVFGHFAVSTGVLALVRSRGGVPIQFYVGQAQPWPRQPEADVPRFVGEFYALNADGGAAPERMTFGWSANWQNCWPGCPPY